MFHITNRNSVTLRTDTHRTITNLSCLLDNISIHTQTNVQCFFPTSALRPFKKGLCSQSSFSESFSAQDVNGGIVALSALTQERIQSYPEPAKQIHIESKANPTDKVNA